MMWPGGFKTTHKVELEGLWYIHPSESTVSTWYQNKTKPPDVISYRDIATAIDQLGSCQGYFL